MVARLRRCIATGGAGRNCHLILVSLALDTHNRLLRSFESPRSLGPAQYDADELSYTVLQAIPVFRMKSNGPNKRSLLWA